MKKLLMLLTSLIFGTSLAYTSEAVVKYKASLTVSTIENSGTKALISKYLITYAGIKTYHPVFAPAPFTKVIATVSTKTRYCKPDTFEYNLYLNKNLWEMPSIQSSIKNSMKSTGFKNIKTNEYGVTMWENSKKEYLVNFTTKITPFIYVNSVCRV